MGPVGDFLEIGCFQTAIFISFLLRDELIIWDFKRAVSNIGLKVESGMPAIFFENSTAHVMGCFCGVYHSGRCILFLWEVMDFSRCFRGATRVLSSSKTGKFPHEFQALAPPQFGTGKQVEIRQRYFWSPSFA